MKLYRNCYITISVFLYIFSSKSVDDMYKILINRYNLVYYIFLGVYKRNPTVYIVRIEIFMFDMFVLLGKFTYKHGLLLFCINLPCVRLH